MFVAFLLPSPGTDDRQVIGAALPTSGLPVLSFSFHATDTEAFARFPEHAPHDQSLPTFAREVLSRPFAVAFALAVAVTLVASFLSFHATGTELFGEVPGARSPCLDFLRLFSNPCDGYRGFCEVSGAR